MRSSAAIPNVPATKQELEERPKGKVGQRKRSFVGKDIEPFTDDQWAELLAQISAGVAIRPALDSCGITKYALDAAVRGDARRRGAYEDAKLAALRQQWDADTLDNIMVEIAMGATVQAACKAADRGDKIPQFYKLVLKDPVVKEFYEEARQIQAEKMAIDDMIEISDDESHDETWDGKPNTAKVNRDRLRTDTRKWIASKLHYKRFGDKIQQDVNANIVVDHAARLEAARKRRDMAHKGNHDK